MISGQTGCYTCGINTYNNGSSLYCHACPPYQKALSGSSSCSYYYQNFLTYKGKMYATLADSAVDTPGWKGQVRYLPLWNFTSIAADDADSRYVIARHYWSANLVVVSGGCVYYAGSNSGGYGCSPGYYLQQRGDEYAVPAGFGLQILITCKQLFMFLVLYEQYISSMS